MKLKTYVAVDWVIHEGINEFSSLANFYKDGLKLLTNNCKETFPLAPRGSNAEISQ